MKQLLEITDLHLQRTKSFGLNIDHLALPAGAILCVAGPNGSGKTTFVECLSGLLAPHKGYVRINGTVVDNNIKNTKALLGLVPDDEAWFIKELCAKEYFELLINVYKKAGIATDMQKRVATLAKSLYFTSFTQPLEQLSHGNKKKVQLIAGLLHEPQVIIVDELRNGLDPLAVIAAEQLIKNEAKRGACIVAATHDLWWAQRVADEILLLINGEPALHDKTTKITQRYGTVEKAFLAAVGMGDKHALI